MFCILFWLLWASLVEFSLEVFVSSSEPISTISISDNQRYISQFLGLAATHIIAANGGHKIGNLWFFNAVAIIAAASFRLFFQIRFWGDN